MLALAMRPRPLLCTLSVLVAVVFPLVLLVDLVLSTQRAVCARRALCSDRPALVGGPTSGSTLLWSTTRVLELPRQRCTQPQNRTPLLQQLAIFTAFRSIPELMLAPKPRTTGGASSMVYYRRMTQCTMLREAYPPAWRI